MFKTIKRYSSIPFKEFKLDITKELNIYNWWENDQGAFRDRSKQPDELFLFPPPNVTGHLHIGHALTGTIQDSLIRYYRMHGKNISWIPGLDHAGIATQSVVERYLWKTKGKTRHQITRAEWDQVISQWKDESGHAIISQCKRLGLSLDWSELYFTLDQKHTFTVVNAFIKLYRDGLIYRDQKMVHWCPFLQSTISDIEVEHLQVSGHKTINIPGYSQPVDVGILYHIGFPLYESSIRNDKHILLVSTTRPETLLGDVALAVHSQDTRYQSYIGKYAWHPLQQRPIPIISDDILVDPNQGTGIVKITPCHDINDEQCYSRHFNDPSMLIDIYDSNGCINIPGPYYKQHRFDARKSILTFISQTLPVYIDKNHSMTIPLCSRTGDIIEFKRIPQWFLSCKPLVNAAREKIDSNQSFFILPSDHRKELDRWFDNIQDWCLSRQLLWGHSIPAYRNNSNPNIWKVEDNVQDNEWKQDSDVLDTWFSAALIPITAMGKNTPNTLSWMETGHDILFFWVARMLMLCNWLTDKLPFNRILLHPLVQDEHGKKMSKSLGNVIDPLEIIDGSSSFQASGADALRQTLISSFAYFSSNRTAFRFQKSKVDQAKRFHIKVYQACRYILSKIDEKYDPLNLNQDISFITPNSGSSFDNLVLQYFKSHLYSTLKEYTSHMNQFHIDKAFWTVHQFTMNIFCGQLIEWSKILLRDSESIYCKDKDQVKIALLCGMRWILYMLHPILPFTTEQCWQALNPINLNSQRTSLMKMKPFSDIESLLSNEIIIDNKHIQTFVSILQGTRYFIGEGWHNLCPLDQNNKKLIDICCDVIPNEWIDAFSFMISQLIPKKDIIALELKSSLDDNDPSSPYIRIRPDNGILLYMKLSTKDKHLISERCEKLERLSQNLDQSESNTYMIDQDIQYNLKQLKQKSLL